MSADWIEYTGTVGKRKPFRVTENGVAKSIAGYTVKFKAWVEGESALTIDGTCVPIVEADGTCYYEFQAADLPSELAGVDLLTQLILDEDAGTDYFPTETKLLQIKEGAPA